MCLKANVLSNAGLLNMHTYVPAFLLQVGGHLLSRLRGLAAKHDIIGDVRGQGLMVGVELVKDRATKVCSLKQTR